MLTEEVAFEYAGGNIQKLLGKDCSNERGYDSAAAKTVIGIDLHSIIIIPRQNWQRKCRSAEQSCLSLASSYPFLHTLVIIIKFD